MAGVCQSHHKKWGAGTLSRQLAIWVSMRAWDSVWSAHDVAYLTSRFLGRPKAEYMVSRGSLEPWGSGLWMFSWKISLQGKTYRRPFGRISKNEFTCPHFVTEEAADHISRQLKHNPCHRLTLEEGAVHPDQRAGLQTYQVAKTTTKQTKKQRHSQHTALRFPYLKEISLSQAAVYLNRKIPLKLNSSDWWLSVLAVNKIVCYCLLTKQSVPAPSCLIQKTPFLETSGSKMKCAQLALHNHLQGQGPWSCRVSQATLCQRSSSYKESSCWESGWFILSLFQKNCAITFQAAEWWLKHTRLQKLTEEIPGSEKIWQSYLKLNEYQFSSILNVDIFLNINL